MTAPPWVVLIVILRKGEIFMQKKIVRVVLRFMIDLA
jgi:hypothetical protein